MSMDFAWKTEENHKKYYRCRVSSSASPIYTSNGLLTCSLIQRLLAANYFVYMDVGRQLKLFVDYSKRMTVSAVHRLVCLWRLGRRHWVWWKPLDYCPEECFPSTMRRSLSQTLDPTSKLCTLCHIHYGFQLRLLAKVLTLILYV
jgi:hypothetical protein